MDTKEDFRFNYSKFKSNKISVEQLDGIASSALEPATGVFGQIIFIIKFSIIGLWLWSRGKLIEEERLIQKQEYESRRVQQGGQDLEEDDLDQLRSQTSTPQGINEGDL